MTSTTATTEQRFDTAIAAGATAAAPVEGSKRDFELSNTDNLRGRPFFEAVEQAAAHQAAS